MTARVFVDTNVLVYARDAAHPAKQTTAMQCIERLWWDSLIVAAAQLQDCDTLLTEDLQHGAVLGDVTVRNPFSPALEESPGRYERESGVARRHRRPGRPRRAARSS